MELPKAIQEYNKSKKAVKITTLKKAKAFELKRYFSGSFATNIITGGGYAYRRIHLLFGAKSSGKNATLNQMVAYNQRICRKCHGILEEHYVNEDRWSSVLKHILRIPMCTCDEYEPKKVLILDYERALAVESPKEVIIHEIVDKNTGELVDELDYNDKKVLYDELRSKEVLEDGDEKIIKDLEKFFDNLNISENKIIQLSPVDYLPMCGVSIDDLLVADPEDTEDGIEIVTKLTKAKEVDIIIWDSLQAAVPRYVKDRDASQATMGIEAKQNGLLMRHACSAFAATDLEDVSEAFKPAFFITSQVRTSLGSFYSTDSYSGGKAVEHHIAIALELKREKFLKEDGTEAAFKEDFYGQNIRLRAEKNKLNKPGGLYHINYYFKEGNKFPIGIDHVDEIVNLGVRENLIERAGAYYRVKGEQFKGMESLVTFFRENPEFVGELYGDIVNK